MCQFHQSAIVRRYLTKKPKQEASQELTEVIDLMTITDKESFVGALGSWLAKWKEYLNERTFNPTTNRTAYTHKKLRSEYNGLSEKRKRKFIDEFLKA